LVVVGNRWSAVRNRCHSVRVVQRAQTYGPSGCEEFITMFGRILSLFPVDGARGAAAFLLGRPVRVHACEERSCFDMGCNECYEWKGCYLYCYNWLVGSDCSESCNRAAVCKVIDAC